RCSPKFYPAASDERWKRVEKRSGDGFFHERPPSLSRFRPCTREALPKQSLAEGSNRCKAKQRQSGFALTLCRSIFFNFPHHRALGHLFEVSSHEHIEGSERV